MEYSSRISPNGTQEVNLTSFEGTVFLECCTLQLLSEMFGGHEAHYVVENGRHVAEQVVIPKALVETAFTALIGNRRLPRS